MEEQADAAAVRDAGKDCAGKDGAVRGPDANPAAGRGPRRASIWRSADYGWWFAADTCGELSASLSGFAMPQLALAVTGSASLSAAIESITLLVQSVANIPGGVLQDRHDRRRLMMLYGVAGAVLFGGVALLGWAGLLGWPVLAAAAVLVGLRAGLFGNASNAMLRGLVDDERLPEALSLNNGRDAVINLAGSPLSGLLMGLGRAVPMLASALSGVAGAFSSWRIRRYWHRTTPRDAGDAGEAAAPDTRPGWRDAFCGLAWSFRYSFQRRVTISAILFNGAINALLLITQLYVTQTTGSPVLAAMVVTVGSIGMLLGAFAASPLVGQVRGGTLCLLSYVGLVIGGFGVAFAPNIWAKGAFLFVGLLLLPAGNAVTGGFTATLVAPSNQGRMLSAQRLCSLGSYALMSAAGGVLMEWFGYTIAAAVFACCLAAGAAVACSIPAIRTLPRPGEWARHIEACGLHRWE